MFTRLVLVAHAPTAATKHAAFPDDEPIEPFAAGALELGALHRLHAAPERRARETAERLGWTAEIAGSLSDLDAGAWRGRSFEDLAEHEAEALTTWLGDPAARPPQGESVEDLIARVWTWLEEQRQRGGRVGAVAHPAVLRAAAIAALGAPAALFWRIDAGPLSMLELRSDGHRWVLRELRAPRAAKET
jgi:broad specificity phosphatase PhoE